MAKRSKRKKPTMAERADRYELYLKAVQEPEAEVPFFDRVYQREYGRRPSVLREDFCGTFAVCCEWVRRSSDRVAVGVDIDPEPLGWGREHHLSKLKAKQQRRVELLQDDVRNVNGPKADVLAAQNFSFWYFKTRDELRRYFSAAYQNLADRGIMVLDMMGGSETIEEDHTDETQFRGFVYHWEQARFDPITHDCSYYIHFSFSDGSKLKRAFEYHWRFWTVPEVCEVLLEAGFSRADVYWEDADAKTGEGTGVYRRRKRAASDPAWICYIVGVKG